VSGKEAKFLSKALGAEVTVRMQPLEKNGAKVSLEPLFTFFSCPESRRECAAGPRPTSPREGAIVTVAS
jgi:hypothetical protein